MNRMFLVLNLQIGSKVANSLQGTKHLETRHLWIWEGVEKAKWFQPLWLLLWGVGVMLFLLNMFCRWLQWSPSCNTCGILWTLPREMILRIDLFHSGCFYIQRQTPCKYSSIVINVTSRVCWYLKPAHIVCSCVVHALITLCASWNQSEIGMSHHNAPTTWVPGFQDVMIVLISIVTSRPEQFLVHLNNSPFCTSCTLEVVRVGAALPNSNVFFICRRALHVSSPVPEVCTGESSVTHPASKISGQRRWELMSYD